MKSRRVFFFSFLFFISALAVFVGRLDVYPPWPANCKLLFSSSPLLQFLRELSSFFPFGNLYYRLYLLSFALFLFLAIAIFLWSHHSLERLFSFSLSGRPFSSIFIGYSVLLGFLYFPSIYRIALCRPDYSLSLLFIFLFLFTFYRLFAGISPRELIFAAFLGGLFSSHSPLLFIILLALLFSFNFEKFSILFYRLKGDRALIARMLGAFLLGLTPLLFFYPPSLPSGEVLVSSNSSIRNIGIFFLNPFYLASAILGLFFLFLENARLGWFLTALQTVFLILIPKYGTDFFQLSLFCLFFLPIGIGFAKLWSLEFSPPWKERLVKLSLVIALLSPLEKPLFQGEPSSQCPWRGDGPLLLTSLLAEPLSYGSHLYLYNPELATILRWRQKYERFRPDIKVAFVGGKSFSQWYSRGKAPLSAVCTDDISKVPSPQLSEFLPTGLLFCKRFSLEDWEQTSTSHIDGCPDRDGGEGCAAFTQGDGRTESGGEADFGERTGRGNRLEGEKSANSAEFSEGGEPAGEEVLQDGGADYYGGGEDDEEEDDEVDEEVLLSQQKTYWSRVYSILGERIFRKDRSFLKDFLWRAHSLHFFYYVVVEYADSARMELKLARRLDQSKKLPLYDKFIKLDN